MSSKTGACVLVAGVILMAVARADDGAISAGWQHSCAVLSDSTIKVHFIRLEEEEARESTRGGQVFMSNFPA